MADTKTGQDSQVHLCNVVPRVVASGAVRRADGWWLRVTLVLMPAKGTGGPAISIAEWPKLIGPEVINALQLRISPIKVEHGKRPEPRQPDPLSPEPTVSWVRRGRAPRDGRHADKVVDLWKRLMAPCNAEGDPWAELLNALSPPGGAAPTDDEPTDIVSMPRSEAAMLISLKRARDALMRMPHADPMQKSAFGPGWDYCGQEPWMGSSGEPLCAAPAGASQTSTKEEADRILGSLAKDLQQATAFRDRQTGYFKSPDPVSALKSRLCETSLASPPSQLAQSIATPSVAAVAGAQNRLRNLHTASTLQGSGDEDVPENQPAPTPAEAAARRLMGLHSQPALQRLFDMTVDLEIHLDRNGLREWLESPSQSTSFDDDCVPNASTVSAAKSRYMFIGADFKGTGASPYLWTAAKLSLPSVPTDALGEAHFWPCTREEIELRIADTAACSDPALRAVVSLRDGVVDLGAMMCEGPRWDIMTLDPIAVESEIQAACCDHAALAGGRPPSSDCRPTLRTLGLALVDRARQAHAIDESVTLERLLRQPKGAVLYAGDLCTGYRMDIGVPRADQQNFEWRALNNRKVQFTDPKYPGQLWIDEVLAACFPGDANEALPTLLAGQVNAPTRVLSLKESKKRIGFAEETTAEWRGDPLGIECRPSVVNIDARHDLGINIAYDLPTDRKSCPPALRLGWRYRLGLRPVFAGGIALPISRAANAYNTAMQGGLAIPDRKQGARRFLRHERIEAPLLTLAKTDLDALRKSGRRELPTAPTAIVRSSSHAEDFIFNTDIAHRVLVAPVVPQVFAAWHGVFDHSNARRPDDGLPGVDFECEHGGFPLLDGSGAVAKIQPANADRRDAVFQLKSAPLKNSSMVRELPYYPDPAAKGMVLAARSRFGDCAWLPGKPLSIDLYAGGKLPYPHAAVVLLEVVAAKRTSPATQSILLLHDPAQDVGLLSTTNGFRPANLANWKPTSAGVPTLRVRVMLAPGEDLDLVSWCVADAATLTRWFDVVESAALVCAASICGSEGSQTSKDELAQGFAKLCSGHLPKDAGPVGEKQSLLCGSGGLDLPSIAQLLRLGQAFHGAMLKRPNPEISSWCSTRVMHAVSRPQQAPRFIETDGLHSPIRPLRTHFRDVVQQLAWVSKNPVSSWAGEGWPKDWIPTGTDAKSAGDPAKADGATDVLLGGTVMIELNTTSGLEIEGSMPFPAHGRFDDPSRRMSDAQRVRGEFPSDPEETWGFKVDREGNVTLPCKSVCMLRIDKLEQPSTQSGRVDTLEPLDILIARKTVRPASCDKDPCAETELRPQSARHIFDDTKARRVTLSMTAYSRFDSEMGEVRGQRPKHMARRSENTQDIWIPSMKRPDRIDPKTLVPTFVWPQPVVSGPIHVERHCRIRLRLKRPWFSSGEDERLGLVVWPHDLTERHNTQLAGNVATTIDGTKDQLWTDFSDASLGKGGAYISRWGSDPIRKGPTPQGWFMPLEAFRDLVPSVSGGAARAELVSKVRMPVPSGDDDPSKVEDRFLTVSLLTYQPKFEWRDEQWYVDIDIDPLDLPYPFVRLGLVRYQPHAHPDLQVSEPVVEWVQLLPRRTVSITFDKAWNGTYPVRVEVRGRGSLRAGRDGAIQEPSEEGSATLQRHRPIMRMRLVRRDDTTGLEHSGESVALGADGTELFWDSGISHKDKQPRQTNEGLSWAHTFLLAENPLDAGNRYAVFIEEIERMRPVSYWEADGVTPLRDLTPEIELKEPLVETGPRFMAYIPLVHEKA